MTTKKSKGPQILPQPPPNFVDRESELAQINRILNMRRWPLAKTRATKTILIWGMGGVGKTDLALEVAYRSLGHFKDGVVWQFVGQSSTSDLLNVIATAFDIPISETLLPQKKIIIQKALTGKRALLIFDNAERTGPIEETLNLVPDCRAIVTSRSMLPLANAHSINLSEMLLPNAVTLFEKIIKREINETEHLLVEQICGCVGRLPLAVTLAAKHVKIAQLDVNDLLQQLIQIDGARLDSLQLRVDGGRSVKVAFESTYQSLDLPDQAAFALLGLFSEQGFSREAVRAVNTDMQAEERLDHLITRSLVRPLGNARYSLHPLLKLFAQEKLQSGLGPEDSAPDKLQASAEIVNAKQRDLTRLRQLLETGLDEGELHTLCSDLGVDYDNLPAVGKANKARELVAHLERQGRLFELPKVGQQSHPYLPWDDAPQTSKTPASLQSLLQGVNPHQRMAEYYWQFARLNQKNFDMLELERPNILIAMDWAQQAQQWTILVGLTEALLGPDAYYSFLAQRGYWDESLERASQALQAATKAQDMAAEARFNADLGLFYYWQGKNEEARTHYQAAITRFEASGNTQGMIQILHRLGFIEDDEDNYAQASELYQRSLKLSEKLGKPDLISVSRCLVAVVDYHQGNYIKARQRMEQSLKEELARGDKAGIARTSRRLGAVARMQGHYAASAEKRRHLDEARRLLGESLKLETNLRSRARGLRQLGMVAQEEGNLKEALKHYSDSLDLFARLGNKKGIASVKCNLGSIYRERGNYEKARQVCQESLVMARELQTHYGEALTLRELAHIAWKERDLSTARNLLQQAVDILESIHSHRTSEFKMELDKLA